MTCVRWLSAVRISRRKRGDWNRIRELLEQIELLLFDKNVHKLELAVHELFIKEVKPSFNFDLGYAVINDLNRLTMKLKDQLNLTQSSASLLFHLDRYFSVEETEKRCLSGCVRFIRKRRRIISA